MDKQNYITCFKFAKKKKKISYKPNIKYKRYRIKMDTAAIAKLLEITYKSTNNNERLIGEESLVNTARINISLYHHLLDIVASPAFPSEKIIIF